MNEKEIEDYLIKLDDVKLDYPFGPDVAVFKVGEALDDLSNSNMFALINRGKVPVRLSLRCDPKLSEVLREKYEEVIPGINLNKKTWNTLILAGQLSWEDVAGLIRLSYDLTVTENQQQV